MDYALPLALAKPDGKSVCAIADTTIGIRNQIAQEFDGHRPLNRPNDGHQIKKEDTDGQPPTSPDSAP